MTNENPMWTIEIAMPYEALTEEQRDGLIGKFEVVMSEEFPTDKRDWNHYVSGCVQRYGMPSETDSEIEKVLHDAADLIEQKAQDAAAGTWYVKHHGRLSETLTNVPDMLAGLSTVHSLDDEYGGRTLGGFKPQHRGAENAVWVALMAPDIAPFIVRALRREARKVHEDGDGDANWGLIQFAEAVTAGLDEQALFGTPPEPERVVMEKTKTREELLAEEPEVGEILHGDTKPVVRTAGDFQNRRGPYVAKHADPNEWPEDTGAALDEFLAESERNEKAPPEPEKKDG